MIDQIIDLFLKQVPEYVQEMQHCVARNELGELHALAHKAKSSVSILGLKQMEQHILKIEYHSRQKAEMETLPKLVEDLIRDSELAFHQLKNYGAQS